MTSEHARGRRVCARPRGSLVVLPRRRRRSRRFPSWTRRPDTSPAALSPTPARPPGPRRSGPRPPDVPLRTDQRKGVKQEGSTSLNVASRGCKVLLRMFLLHILDDSQLEKTAAFTSDSSVLQSIVRPHRTFGLPRCSSIQPGGGERPLNRNDSLSSFALAVTFSSFFLKSLSASLGFFPTLNYCI